ncbi:MlaD family protein [Jannaschia aquimarina]|uniref:PqiB protein n=1 Tax=Jannaschia aquimarina TaxID=935700 RepID=A0A0D1EEU1_9RHOB|nr:MlaD family protein [Jannaschia aquimarina]KIT15401.1 Paraquat-inducible protein B [Jannaschia aquimarina]SNT22831.1 paraquat-inducible protein B [Jannaschia aquimarina]
MPAISAVWLVPIIAIFIALAIAWQSWQNRGVVIQIQFPDASGVTVGETTLRYREVIVGVVEDVGFSSDLASVNVYIRVNSDIAPFLDETASFWIVQPEVTARGVEGLSTILSGTYIEGTWDNRIGDPQTEFVANDRAPIVPPNVEGTAIVLRSGDDVRLDAGAPILYRGIEVGEVSAPRLSPDGSEIRLDAFVRAPYDRQLSTATRFWDSSGVRVSVGGSGVQLNIGSVATLLEGGVSFDTLISGGTEIETGTVFDIFPEREAALASTFEAPALRSVRFSALFPSASSGLSEGAPVRYQGVRVGTVASITGFIRPDDPQRQVELLAVVALQPTRMGLTEMRSDLEGVDFVGDLVDTGLRARLVSTSILGGDLAIELVNVPDAPPDSLQIGISDTPIIPTVEPDTEGLAATAEGVLARIGELPVDEMIVAATDLLNNLNRIAGSDETRALPGAALDAIEQGEGLARDARAIVSSNETAAVLNGVREAVADLQAITARLAEQDVADALSSTLAAAEAAAANIAAGTEDLPALSESARSALDSANRLIVSDGVQALPDEASALLAEARAVIAAPEIRALIEDLPVISEDLRTITSELRSAQAASALTSALDAAERAATSFADSTTDLPELTASARRVTEQAEVLAERLTQLTEKANALALDELVNSTTDLMTTADAFLSSDDAGDVPVVLSETLQELRRTIETIRTGGTLDNLNATLNSASGAADSIRIAAEDLPALVNRLQGLTTSATGVLSTYDSDSRVAQELFATLRAATRAAEDVSSLSRTIERNPNSLLLGR